MEYISPDGTKLVCKLGNEARGYYYSAQAFESQDGKVVPLIWRAKKDPFVIGTAHLYSEEDGIKAEMHVTCSKEDYINHYLTKPQRFLRKIKKWLGIVSPSEEHWPWEEENCDLSMKFKEDKYDSRNK